MLMLVIEAYNEYASKYNNHTKNKELCEHVMQYYAAVMLPYYHRK